MLFAHPLFHRGREKMLEGQLFDGGDPELLGGRYRQCCSLWKSLQGGAGKHMIFL